VAEGARLESVYTIRSYRGFEPRLLRQLSFYAPERNDMMIPIIPEDEIEVSFCRSSGPGGQNVNKTNTKVMVSWIIRRSQAFTEEQKEAIIKNYQREVIRASNQETRSQLENKIRAINKLNKMVRSALKKEIARIPTKPSLGSRFIRLFNKHRLAEIKSLRQKPEKEE
jgi:ribosome-associated protein